MNGSVTSATICAVLGTLLVLAVRKSHSKLRKVVEAIGLLPEMLPGIVLVIGIMLFWNQIYNILPLYNTMGILSAIMGAFCLSSAACPFFCAQYSRSVTRFLLPFKRSI